MKEIMVISRVPNKRKLLKNLVKNNYKVEKGYSDQPPNGESLEDVVRRFTKYFEEVIKPAIQSDENDNILIAAHGNSLRRF